MLILQRILRRVILVSFCGLKTPKYTSVESLAPDVWSHDERTLSSDGKHGGLVTGGQPAGLWTHFDLQDVISVVSVGHRYRKTLLL